MMIDYFKIKKERAWIVFKDELGKKGHEKEAINYNKGEKLRRYVG